MTLHILCRVFSWETEMSINFKKIGAIPYHATSTLFIGVTTNSERAHDYAAEEPAVIRVNQDRWPKEINKFKKKIRFVLKEAGERNFLVVLQEGSVV